MGLRGPPDGLLDHLGRRIRANDWKDRDLYAAAHRIAKTFAGEYFALPGPRDGEHWVAAFFKMTEAAGTGVTCHQHPFRVAVTHDDNLKPVCQDCFKEMGI